MASKRLSGEYLILFAMSLPLIFVFYWFFASRLPNDVMALHRFVICGFVLFFLPGLLWAEVFGFSSDHPLQALSLALATSISFQIVLVLIILVFEWTLDAWVLMVLGGCVVALIRLFPRVGGQRGLGFITGLTPAPKGAPVIFGSRTLTLALILLFCWSTFRWGENLFDLSSEKIIHLQYVRKYFTIPFQWTRMGMLESEPSPNLVHFWEILIAGWAKMSGMDPAVVFFRSRCIVPLAGLASMYLLTRAVFQDPKKTEVIFWGVLLLALALFILHPPTSLGWINPAKTAPTRLATSFAGSLHHGDTAMDILLPLGAALCLLALRQSHRYAPLLFGVLLATFFWHPREYLQLGIYFGLATIMGAFIAARNRTHPDFRAWLYVVAAFVLVAIVVLLIMKSALPSHASGYDEMGIKRLALRNAFTLESLLGFRNPFNFSLHVQLSASKFSGLTTWSGVREAIAKSWNFDLWLFMSYFSVPILAIFGGRDERRLAWFFVLLWTIVAAWDFGILMTLFFTYSEILMTVPRFVYIYSYLMVPAALLCLLRFTAPGRRGTIVFSLAAVFILGGAWALKWWFSHNISEARVVSQVLWWGSSGVLILSIFLPVIGRSDPDGCTYVAAFFPLLLFCVILFSQDYRDTARLMFHFKRPPVSWYTDKNPMKYSPKLIAFVQGLPPGRYFAIDPVYPSAISIYAPHYELINISTFLASQPDRRLLEKGRHPLFQEKEIPPGPDEKERHLAILEWIDKGGFTHLVVRGRYFKYLVPYFRRHPKLYREVFLNPEAKESVYLRLRKENG